MKSLRLWSSYVRFSLLCSEAPWAYLYKGSDLISSLLYCKLQMPLALLSLLMEMVPLMSPGLIILSRRLNWRNVVFRMRLSRSWVLRVVVCSAKAFASSGSMCLGLILKWLWLDLQGRVPSWIICLERTLGKWMLLEEGMSCSLYTSWEEQLAYNLRFFNPWISLFSDPRRLRVSGLLDALVLSLAPLWWIWRVPMGESVGRCVPSVLVIYGSFTFFFIEHQLV